MAVDNKLKTSRFALIGTIVQGLKQLLFLLPAMLLWQELFALTCWVELIKLEIKNIIRTISAIYS